MKRLAALGLTLVLVTGCLTPEQRAEFRAQGKEAATELVKLRAEYDAWVTLGEEIATKFKNGEISLADFSDGMAEVNRSKEVVLQAIDKARALKDDADEKLEGTPWYDRIDAWLQIIVGGVVGLGGATATSRMRRKVNLITGKPKPKG